MEKKKKWPMDAASLFYIRNNLIGVAWKYDDAESDSINERIKFYRNHGNNGIFIYI